MHAVPPDSKSRMFSELVWTIGNEEAAWQCRGVQTGDTAPRRHQNMSWDLHFSRASIDSKALNDFTTMITNLFFIIHWQNINSHWEANGSDCHRNNQLSMGETSDTPCLVQHRAHVDSIFRHTTCMLWVYEMRISNYMLMFHYLYNHSI